MSIVDAWLNRIRHDLAPFIDPSTTLEISASGSAIDALWTQRRRLRSARFVVRDAEGVYVAYDGKELSYRAFFASEDMADVTGIAQTSRDILAVNVFVETRASSEDVAGAIDVPALDLISSLASQRDESDTLTNFVMVTGEAGAGKTSVLKELVRRQAEAYLSGSAEFVYLYVNAQGRALARFNEALATELNELRVALPHHAVAPLVKMGLIVPVIDGFDELIGVGGYDDAFSSISSFVAALEGKGAIVASARSTYYEQEFLSRTSRNAAHSTDAWKLVSVAVKGWGDEERKKYVESKLSSQDSSRSDEILVSLNRVFSGENEALSSKPLFVARATDFLLNGLLSVEEGALLDRLVSAFVVREQKEKLLRKDGGSILSEQQIRDICSDLAEEMWNLGTRELDRATVKDIAEVALAGVGLTPSDQMIVIERIPNMAFLQPGDSAGTVGFEHEIFFDYFLANRIASSVAINAPSLTLLLSRSAMPDSLADSVANRLIEIEKRSLADVVSSLSSVSVKYSPRQQLVRENAGQLVGRLVFRVKDLASLKVAGLVFPGSTFHGVSFKDCAFEYCDFRRCDFTAAAFISCSAVAVSFESPLVDSGTRLELDGLDLASFFGIRKVDGDTVRVVYDPQVITEFLVEAGVPGVSGSAQARARDVATEVVGLIERLARAYAKCNPICVQDDYLHGIFDDQNWPAVQKIAVESGVLKHEIRAANGPRRDFVRRLVRPEDLLAGMWRGADVPDQVNAFWKQIEVHFPGA